MTRALNFLFGLMSSHPIQLKWAYVNVSTKRPRNIIMFVWSLAEIYVIPLFLYQTIEIFNITLKRGNSYLPTTFWDLGLWSSLVTEIVYILIAESVRAFGYVLHRIRAILRSFQISNFSTDLLMYFSYSSFNLFVLMRGYNTIW